MEPEGTILFSTVGLHQFGFDVFSVSLPSDQTATSEFTERRHTDGVSVNFNAQFVDEGDSVAFVSERTGSARLFLARSEDSKPEPLPGAPDSLFHDRPTVKDGRVYFVSAHEPPSEPIKSWAAVYTTRLGSTEPPVRVTPPSVVDFSPAVSQSGDLIAVASYGSRKWKGDFRELETEITVFRAADPSNRTVVCGRGGWPSWCGDSAVFFHRKADDGWWSVFRSDLTPELDNAGGRDAARRITPAGVHALTPAAAHDGKRIAVATRRKGMSHRQIEIFDLESEQFYPITELINPNIHHYNPFFSPGSGHLGYHRFRGEPAKGDSIVRYLQPVASPLRGLRLLRVHGAFASFSPDGNLIAANGDFFSPPGLMIHRSDGSKRWILIQEPSSFYTAWNPRQKGVIYTSVGPIFDSTKATVRIARITFDPADLDDSEQVPAAVTLLTRSGPGNDAFPSCSPDGKWLVFRSGRSGQKNLYILDAVNGETESGDGIRRLTEGEWIDTMPAWSPDGELIAFSSNRHNPSNADAFSIYLVRPDGSDLRRVYVAGPEGSPDVDRERINHVCFSPDSRWLLFTCNLGSVTGDPVSMPHQFQPYGDLYMCRLDGTGLKRLTCNVYENGTPAWHATSGVPDLGSLSLGPTAKVAGEKLQGRFDEPLWLTCDL